jgi:hypothetical protein
LVPALEVAAPQNWIPGKVRSWEDDPRIDTLLGVSQSLPESLIRKFSYGRTLYREHRCAWLHSSAPGPGLGGLELLRNDPYYFPGQTGLRLFLPRNFLITTFDRAMTYFESECKAKNVVP